MAHSKTRTNDGKITYPPGVKEISDKISKEEMVRRLKMVVKTFMDMDQDSEEEKELYLNLALHLASDFFLKHPDKDVRLLVACCLADIFRIYAPEAPYTSPDKLKNIAWVKSYNICFELEDSNEIFTQLYRTLFSVINNGHNQKVHMHMVDLMSSIICEGDTVSQELLDTVLVNLVPAHKSNDNDERLQVVKLLAKMFGAKDSELASQNKPLWQCYLGRFNDIHVPIRLECVKFASHCLMNHPDLAKDLTEYLKVRSHDPEEAIRHDVIVSIVTAAKKDILLVNDHLLNFVRERTLDKRWRVRKEAMMGLAQIYKKYSLQSAAGKDAAKQISWIKDKLLHIYYQNSIDDRLLVERIFAQYMVPHNLETTERMKCLYYLYATLDLNAVKALNEMWKCQNLLRHQVKDLLDLIKQPKTDASVKAIFSKVMVITRNLPDPGKAQDFMKKFTQVLEDDEKIRKQLEALVSPTCSCKQAEGCVREITKKLGNPKQPTNPFLEMIKFLLERIAPVHIDTESISALIKQVNKSIDGTADDEDEGVPTDQAIRAGLELLKVLSFTHPISFHSAETFESLLACLKMDDEKVAEAALQIFKNTGSKIEEDFPHIRSALLPVLHHKSKKGPPRQAKYAIHCIHAIFSSKETQFAQIFEPLHKSLDPSNLEHLITPLVTIGHIALLAPDQFAAPLKSLVATFIVKDLLMNDRLPGKKTTKLWVPDEEVSPETMVKDECYQVRQVFAQKLHKGLSRLRLPLEYMAICALCAKDPVKERRAHARQCLVKNINVRREYLKQHAAVSEKLLSLLPEYVVPYTIHLLAHDPDYVKVQDIEQLKDVKECLWFVLEILMAKNENNSHAFIRKMVENIKQTKDAQGPDDAKMNEKLYTVCDVAMNIIMSKSTTYSLESPKDPVLPARFFTQPDKNFSNTKNYLPPEMKSFFTPGKPKTTNVLGAVNKPLSSAGKQSQTKSSRMETVSNASSSSNPSSPGRIKGRLDSSEMDHSENEDYTMSSPLPGKKSDKRDDSDLVRSELEKPRGRKKTPVTDPEEKLGMDDLTKLVQEQKPKGNQRSRKRGHTASESDEQQWPEEKRLKEDILENEDEQNSPPKKGKRGRPPKPLGGGTPKEEPTMKTSKKGSKKKSGPPVAEEEEEEERQSGNTEQKSKSKQHRTSRRAQQRAESPETSAVESTQSTPQKGRGRPSKMPSPSQPKKNVRVGRAKQAATKENDSSEEVDVFQGSSPVNDDIPQEETEEEEVSTVNVCIF
ncbi:Sister chromatid cohesion protein PDS5 like protein B [Tupaia chinensis]|uniref:Sister chromatid cohesion protein PDS5 like protein B n=1 Tax=Tupaia chinensis TaxID=246437 RepID=L9JCQ6_TUPCH|nr:Sister chromatid cohesion protein PDS5 like protein B [Tupaia chinensis]